MPKAVMPFFKDCRAHDNPVSIGIFICFQYDIEGEATVIDCIEHTQIEIMWVRDAVIAITGEHFNDGFVVHNYHSHVIV
jgi:hypothetical protein